MAGERGSPHNKDDVSGLAKEAWPRKKGTVMKGIAMTMLAASACLAATIAMAEDSTTPANAAPVKVTTTCQSCHGPGGNSVSGAVPRLNGQKADYLFARLNNFLDPTREDPHAMASMWSVVSATDHATFGAIANYYAGQTPTAPQSGPFSAEGKRLYVKGAASLDVPACQTCHGVRGEGRGAVPRLAGQHADYLTKQLERLRLATRESGVMHPNTRSMTDAQIKALVSYLAND